MKNLLVILTLASCVNSQMGDTGIQQEPTVKRIDSIHTKSDSSWVHPSIFETSFFAGANAMMDTIPISFYKFDIGRIHIESGKIIASDPGAISYAKPISQMFPKGIFPVQLAIAKINQDERIAFSRILFSDSQVVKWAFALPQGEKQAPIDGDKMYGYRSEGGSGLFCDENAQRAFATLLENDRTLWERVFVQEISKQYRHTWNHILYEFNGHNFAAFSTGYGDGFYGTFVGYDKKGNICRLLTDFALVEWRKKVVK